MHGILLRSGAVNVFTTFDNRGDGIVRLSRPSFRRETVEYTTDWMNLAVRHTSHQFMVSLDMGMFIRKMCEGSP